MGDGKQGGGVVVLRVGRSHAQAVKAYAKSRGLTDREAAEALLTKGNRRVAALARFNAKAKSKKRAAKKRGSK